MVLQHGEQYSYDQRETRQEVEHCAHKIKHLDILNRGHVNEGQIQQVAQRKGAQKAAVNRRKRTDDVTPGATALARRNRR